MFILEAHPDNENFGLYLAGNEQEVERLNDALLLGTLGALATDAAGVEQRLLLDYLTRERSSSGQVGGILRPFTPIVGALLGTEETLGANLKARLDLLTDETVAGHLTMGQFLGEAKSTCTVLFNEPPTWLTYEGVYAQFSGERIVPETQPVAGSGKGLTEYEHQLAQELGADHFASSCSQRKYPQAKRYALYFAR